MATLVIMRGIYGCGKSTWAKKHYPDAVYCSADDFHVKKTQNKTCWPVGPEWEKFKTYTYEYKWDMKKQGEAHQSCLAKVLSAMMVEGGSFMQLAEKVNFDKGDRRKDIVVDNTHAKRWEYENYVRLGMLMGYTIRIVQIQVETVAEVQLCAKRGIHPIPPEVVGRKMLEFEDDSRAEMVPLEGA